MLVFSRASDSVEGPEAREQVKGTPWSDGAGSGIAEHTEVGRREAQLPRELLMSSLTSSSYPLPSQDLELPSYKMGII